jgi:hypothetical protein
MDDRPSQGFWIAGTLFLLAMLFAFLLPIFLLAGGKPAFGILIGSLFFLFESFPFMAGLMAFVGTIVLIVRLVNRRRDPR